MDFTLLLLEEYLVVLVQVFEDLGQHAQADVGELVSELLDCAVLSLGGVDHLGECGEDLPVDLLLGCGAVEDLVDAVVILVQVDLLDLGSDAVHLIVGSLPFAGSVLSVGVNLIIHLDLLTGSLFPLEVLIITHDLSDGIFQLSIKLVLVFVESEHHKLEGLHAISDLDKRAES